MALTQQVIATHLGLSQPQVSTWLQKLNLDVEKNTLDEIRLGYIAALRLGASSSAPSSERERWYRVRRKREELRLAREERELVPVAVALDSFSRSVHGVKARVFALPSKIAPLVAGQTEIRVIAEMIRGELTECFQALADGEIDRIVEDACELTNGERK